MDEKRKRNGGKKLQVALDMLELGRAMELLPKRHHPASVAGLLCPQTTLEIMTASALATTLRDKTKFSRHSLKEVFDRKDRDSIPLMSPVSMENIALFVPA